MGSLRHWFVQKYQLPPSHALFVGRSEAELMLEMLSDLHVRARSVRAQAEGVTGPGSEKQREVLYESLNAILDVLGEPREEFDPVIAQWEADMEAGRTPDLKRR